MWRLTSLPLNARLEQSSNRDWHLWRRWNSWFENVVIASTIVVASCQSASLLCDYHPDITRREPCTKVLQNLGSDMMIVPHNRDYHSTLRLQLLFNPQFTNTRLSFEWQVPIQNFLSMSDCTASQTILLWNYCCHKHTLDLSHINSNARLTETSPWSSP